MMSDKELSYNKSMKERVESLVESGEHVFLDICPRRDGKMWSEEGVIKRLDAKGWFQIEFMGSTNGWHVNQIVNIKTD
jgi:hypothetical protein